MKILSKHLSLCAVIILALTTSIYSIYPSLVNHYTVNDDIFHWFWNTSYKVSYNFLFIQLSKYMPILISICISILLYFIGKKLKDTLTGFLTAFLALFYYWQTFILFGANNRAFGLLLVVIFLYTYLIKPQPFIIFLTFIFGFMYPPVYLIMVLSWFFYFVYNYKKLRTVINIRSILVAIGLLLVTSSLIYVTNTYRINNLVTLNQISTMPEFSSHGREMLFNLGFVKTIESPKIGLYFEFPLIFLLFLNLLILFFKPKSPNKLNFFLFAGIISYILSLILLPRLYLPGRYLTYSLPLVLIIFFSANFSNLCSIKPNLSKYILGMFIALCFVLFITYFDPFLINCKDNELYDYINYNLLPSVNLSGFPRTMDCVFKYSQLKFNNVKPMYEFVPFYLVNWYEVHKKLTFALFDAYYSNSVNKIVEFCKENKITHLLVEEDLYSVNYFQNGWNQYQKEKRAVWFDMPFPELQLKINRNFKKSESSYLKNRSKYDLYFQPYDNYIRNITYNRTDFYLLNIPAELKLYNKDGIFIVDCQNMG